MAASAVRAPAWGTNTAAAPAPAPAISGHRNRPSGWSRLANAAQATTIDRKVANQWWLICIHGHTDIITHATARKAESGAFFEAWRQARKVKQAIPTMVRTASDRAEPKETPATLNHAAVRTAPPGAKIERNRRRFFFPGE